MSTLLLFLVRWLQSTRSPRVALQFEVVAPRHQLAVYQRTCRRPRITPADRILWSYLTRVWAGWRKQLFLVKPATIIAWQRKRFRDSVSIDFYTVPAVRFHALFVFLVLAHHRRRVVHFNVTANPTSQWTAHQVVEAFPWDSAPRYLLRDRDSIYGSRFRSRVHSLGIEETLIAPRSPWQSPYVERLIGSIRRDCVDHVIILNENPLKRVLASYFHCYHRWRVHRSLEMDSPETRPIQPPELGQVVEFPDVRGLHHHYLRRAA